MNIFARAIPLGVVLALGMTSNIVVAEPGLTATAPDAGTLERVIERRGAPVDGEASWASQVRHGTTVSVLQDGNHVDVDFVWKGIHLNLDQFMARNSAVAVLVLKNGKVVAEEYRYGNRPDTLWPVASVTKSVLSMLVGAAVQDGSFHVTDKIVDYVPEMKGSAYDGVTVRDLLRMSSGVDMHDDYIDKNSPYQKFQETMRNPDSRATINFLRNLRRAAQPGTQFSYVAADPYLLGVGLARAVKMPLSVYLSKKIWQPAGMEYDAVFQTDIRGQELASGGLRVTLRDMARFGELALEKGMVGRKHLVAPQWIADGSEVRSGTYLAPGAIEEFRPWGYGYYWWTMPRGDGKQYEIGDDGAFAAQGVFGQQIYVVPKQNVVVVIQSAWKDPVEFDRFAAGRSLANAFTLRLMK